MEDPALSPSADDSDPSSQVHSTVEGDSNQVIDKVTGGNVIGNITGNVTIPTINNYYYREELQILIDDAKYAEVDQLPCPYRGLFHFGPGDAEYFFGRESFVEELVKATQTRNFIPLLGASGSGKSSVVLAGLVPKLQQMGHWQFTHFRPGADPFQSLALALVPLYTTNLDETERIRQARNLANYFRTGEVLLSDVFDQIQQNYPSDRVLLIADQFEELYTLCTDETTRRNFLDKLLAGISLPTNKIPFAPVLVATMRADFLGNALSYRPFADLLQNSDLKLGPMNRLELAEVIEKPAQKLGITFEAGLVERILGDVEEEPGNLPLLEFALTELWQRRSGKQLSHAAYEAIGEVQGALGRHANKEYDKLSDAEREQVRRIFIQLVRPGEGAEDTRRIAMKVELGEQSWSLVKQLADARLVVTSRNASNQETVEVVHEALIRNWSELRGWMDTDRVFRAWQERLRGAVRQWHETQKDQGSLLRGAALAEAEEYLQQRPEELISESDFIRKSLSEQERQKQAETTRRKREIKIARSITAGSLVAAIISGGFGLMAWKQTQQAELNLANALGFSALSLFDKGKELNAFVQAIKAGKILQAQNSSNSNVTNALQEALNLKSEQNRLEGHDNNVNSISFSPDNKILATGSSDKTIKLWDVVTGREIRTLQGHNNVVKSVSFSPDRKTLASGSDDKTIKIWDVNTGKEIRTLQGHNSVVMSVSFSQDSKTLAVGSADNTVTLWNMETGNEISVLKGHKSVVISVSFSPDRKTLATGSRDKTIKLWDLSTGKEIRTLKGHEDSVNSVSFSFDRKTLATGSEDRTVKLWDVVTGQEIRTLKGHDSWVWSVNFSSDGKTLVSGSEDRTVKLWDVVTGQEIRTLKGHDNPVKSVSFSSDDKILATGSSDNTVKLWNLLDKGKEVRTLKGHDSWVWSVNFSSDGKTLVTGSGDNTIKLWNVETNEVIRTFKGHEDSVFSARFSTDEKILATGSADNTIKLWDVATGKEIRTLKGHENSVYSVSFSPDRKTLATGSKDKTIKLWDLETGKEIRTLKSHDDRVYSVNFSHDGKRLATGSQDKKIKIWDIDTGKEIRTIQSHNQSVYSVSFSHDDKTLATGSEDKTIKLWNMETGREVHTLRGHNNSVRGVSFSHDDKILATGSEDNTIKLWNVYTGKEIRTFQGHSNSVRGVSFSHDDKTLATGSEDNTIKLWNRETGWDLDSLMGRSCDWVRVYLQNNPKVSESDKHLCDGIGTQN
jgi:WD40 repeat protein